MNTVKTQSASEEEYLNEVPFWLAGELPVFVPLEIPPVNPVVEQLYRHPLLRELPGENKRNAAFSPYGYLYDPESMCMMKLDPTTAPIVQGIFQMYLAGVESNRIAKFLTARKIPTPCQRRVKLGYHYKKPRANDYWSSVSVRNILKNPVYVGDHIYRLPHLPKGVKEQAFAELIIPSGSVIHHHHEPLVSEADFESAGILLRLQEQAFREHKAKLEPSKTQAQKSLFRGQIYCSVCGRPMIHTQVSHHNPQKIQTAYICSSSLKKLPDACPRIIHPSADIIQEVTVTIKAEREIARKVSSEISGGTSSSAYSAANRKIASQLADVLDEARAAKTNGTVPDPANLQARFSALINEKNMLFNTFTLPNKWLEAFSNLPEDFTLDRPLAKKLVNRIIISEDGTCKITLTRQDEKAIILRYLC